MDRGIIVGADISQEWILPWWWDRYRKSNRFPVAFADFGLSFEMKEWCKLRGELLSLRLFDFTREKEELDPEKIQKWEGKYGKDLWDLRGAWFKKPFACLRSPFERSIWIDLDCEVKKELNSLFEFDLAMVKDPWQNHDPYPIYNGGVVVFQRDHDLIKKWAEKARNMTDIYETDQELLSHLISEKSSPFVELPAIYNWSRCLGENPDSYIHHWHGARGKTVIRHQLSRWA